MTATAAFVAGIVVGGVFATVVWFVVAYRNMKP